MISGRRPFEGNDRVQLASSKLGTDAPPLSSTGQLVPQALEHLIASLLQRDRGQRPASAQDVLSQLRAISGTKARSHFRSGAGNGRGERRRSGRDHRPRRFRHLGRALFHGGAIR
jgi:hypothetical protein